MNPEEIVKSTQEQAVASWINYLNAERIQRMQDAIKGEEKNYTAAAASIKEALDKISKEIVNNGKGRGGAKGMHGFIAEVAETGVENARRQIEGKAPICEWINDYSEADLKRGAVLIQQKFANYGNHLSLQAIQKHLDKYPDFIKNGGKYQIPEDHYEKVRELLSISENEANKMATQTGDFSLKQWKEVKEFFDEGKVGLKSIEPSKLEYKQVQRDTYEKTLYSEKNRLRERNSERIKCVENEHELSIKEGAKVTAVAAVAEGAMTFCIDVAKKRSEGKRLKEFTEDDWKEISGDTVFGTLKGGIRGVSIYVLTNKFETPAAAANAVVTASFGVAEQAYRFRKGELTEEEFIINSEMLCLDASVSALSSILGQTLIPVPVIGALIGNAVGTTLYHIAKDNLSAKEEKLIKEYLAEIRNFKETLDAEYKSFVEELNEDMEMFLSILDMAFAPDVRIAFQGSIELAKNMGVSTEEILDSKEKIAAYFME